MHRSHLRPVTRFLQTHRPVVWSQSSRTDPYTLQLHATVYTQSFNCDSTAWMLRRKYYTCMLDCPQWSFRKIGAIGTLASQADSVWVQAPGALLLGITPDNFWDIYRYAKSCNLVLFGPKMVHNAVHSAFSNILTMETTSPRVPPLNDPWCTYSWMIEKILTIFGGTILTITIYTNI